MIWFRRNKALTSDVLRTAAESAGVAWDYQPIGYKDQKVGYLKGESSDANIIQNELENILGYPPTLTEDPIDEKTK
jgi:hypothetical protein